MVIFAQLGKWTLRELRDFDRNVFVETRPDGVFLPAVHGVSFQDVFGVVVERSDGGLLGDDGFGPREEGEARGGI